MFVEYVTTYNFDIETEMHAFRQYRKILKGWDCVEKGAKIIAIEKHESISVDLSNVTVDLSNIEERGN